VALVVAVPISVATALMINEYGPRSLRRSLIALVDLLAALPSLIFGLWGLRYLSSHVFGTTRWLSRHADFIPFFRTPQQLYGNSLFLCGLVVSVMIVPIMTSVSREVMSQVPREQCEAALALGGTRWAMVTEVILPYARKGIVGGALLGLGRALGETIAILLILGGSNTLWSHILSPGGGAVSSLIAREFSSLPPQGDSALSLAGLMLFAMTLVISLAARAIVGRKAPALS
jgi:phosphate transport system permease protein